MKFLYNLDFLLVTYNMTRSELARRADIAPSTVNSWYSKDYRGVTLKNLLKLSRYFDISIEDLVNGDVRSLMFTIDNFSEAELKAIKDFSDYLKKNRKN